MRAFNVILRSCTPDGGVEAEEGALLAAAGGRRGLSRVLEELARSTLRPLGHLERLPCLVGMAERRGNGRLRCRVHPALASLSHRPAVFAALPMDDVMAFRNPHALALYEAVMLRSRLRSGRAWEVDLDSLRALLGTQGHARFDSFRLRVLEPAVREVSLLSRFDLDVSYARAGRGGGVIGVRFSPSARRGGRSSVVPQSFHAPHGVGDGEGAAFLDWVGSRLRTGMEAAERAEAAVRGITEGDGE